MGTTVLVRASRMLLHGIILLGCALLDGQALAQETSAEDAAPPAPTLLQVDERIYLGVIPKHADLENALNGFEVVLDLRYPYEGIYDEAGKLRSIGVVHINLPTSSHGPDLKKVKLLEAQLAKYPDKKILIHDSNGHRSAMMWAAHVLNSGGDMEQALASVEAFYERAELEKKLERFETEMTAAARD